MILISMGCCGCEEGSSGEIVCFGVNISAVVEEGIGEVYLMEWSRLECVTRERRKHRNVRSMILVVVSNTDSSVARELYVRFVFRGMASDAILRHLGSVPDMQFPAEEEFSGFSNDSWEGYKTDPPPGCDETKSCPGPKGCRVDAGLIREDSCYELHICLG